MLAANGFVISQHDLDSNRERSVKYLTDLSEKTELWDSEPQSISVPPSRVYPINHINLARVDTVGEIGLFRYSIHTLLTQTNPKSPGNAHAKEQAHIPCYPVVMFRSDLSVQIALLRELYRL